MSSAGVDIGAGVAAAAFGDGLDQQRRSARLHLDAARDECGALLDEFEHCAQFVEVVDLGDDLESRCLDRIPHVLACRTVAQPVEPVAQQTVEVVEDRLFLAREVVVERAGRNTRFGGDGVGGDRSIPPIAGEPGRGRTEGCPGGSLLAVAQSRLGTHVLHGTEIAEDCNFAELCRFMGFATFGERR